nr:hypothetical protein [Streptomyces phyllanthi]
MTWVFFTTGDEPTDREQPPGAVGDVVGEAEVLVGLGAALVPEAVGLAEARLVGLGVVPPVDLGTSHVRFAVQGDCTSVLPGAAASPRTATHLRECTATRLYPEPETARMRNCWLVLPLQVYWVIGVLSDFDRPFTSTHFFEFRVPIVKVLALPETGVNLKACSAPPVHTEVTSLSRVVAPPSASAHKALDLLTSVVENGAAVAVAV